MIGREHWDEADRLLSLVASHGGGWPSEEALIVTTRALAHAALAAAANQYGLHRGYVITPAEDVASKP